MRKVVQPLFKTPTEQEGIWKYCPNRLATGNIAHRIPGNILTIGYQENTVLYIGNAVRGYYRETIGKTACTMAHRMARHIGDIVSALTWDRQYCPSDPKENSKYYTADRGKKIIHTPYLLAENTGSSLSKGNAAIWTSEPVP